MKENQNFEINLNFITIYEQGNPATTFEEYKKIVNLLLQLKNLYLSEKEVFEFANSTDIERILQEIPHIRRTGAYSKNEDGTFSHRYINLAERYFVQPEDYMYDAFFAYRIRHIDLIETDSFLAYHYEKYYHNNLREFSRFIHLCMRKHKMKLGPETIESVNEWIEAQEKQSQSIEIGGTEQEKTRKGRVKRNAGDKLTCLSQEQTVLLMYYLQQERVLLKDEYLTDMDAGKAFEILTGYSQHTLRQNLSKYHHFQNKTNLKEIDHLLTRLKILIDKDMKG